MSNQQIAQYPASVQNYMVQLNQKTGISYEQIIAEFNKEYEKSAQLKEQFPTASEEELADIRMNYAIGKVWRDLINLPPLEDVEIIYIGHNGLDYATGSKKAYSNMYVLVRDGPTAKIMRIAAQGDKFAELFRAMSPLTKYSATLGRFEGQDTFRIDHRCKFSNPTLVPQMTLKAFNQVLRIPVITVAEAIEKGSKTQSDGYVVDTDWRCIMGYFSGDPRTFTNKRGAMRGVCNITDITVTEKPYTNQQGNIVTPGMTGWVAPEHLIWDPESFLAFYGPVKVNVDKDTQKKDASMSIYYIRPILATEVSAGVSDN